MRPNNWLQRDDAKDWFLMSVQKTESCWLWSAGRDKNGYGRVTCGRRARKAHRVSYELFVGEISPGSLVRHRCDHGVAPRTVRDAVNGVTWNWAT